MSNIFFKTISFKKESYSYAYVDGKVLNIVLDGVDVPVEFCSHNEAIDGLQELNSILNGETKKSTKVKSDLDVLVEKIKSGEVLDILNNCNDKLRSVIGGVGEQIQEKALEKAFKHVSKKAESRIDDMVKDIDAVLNHMFTKEIITDEEPEVQPTKEKPTIVTKVKRNFGFSDDAFGFSNVRLNTDEEPELDEMLIGDMTTVALKQEIAKFVDSLLSSERAEQMFGSISENFGKEATEQAVQAFKDLIYTVCLSNPDKTLEQVLRENFK